jgi:hypothetical protein
MLGAMLMRSVWVRPQFTQRMGIEALREAWIRVTRVGTMSLPTEEEARAGWRKKSAVTIQKKVRFRRSLLG